MKNAKQLGGCYTRLLGTEKKMILSPVSCCGPQPKVVEQEEGHPHLGVLKEDTGIDIEELTKIGAG